MKRLVAIKYNGGKQRMIDFIIPLLPKTRHYCEPFGGGASILLNREPSKIETYNDIDGEVVNFFRALRDNGDELQRRLELTPYSREEFDYAKGYDGDDSIERARCFFVLCNMSFSGSMSTFGVNVKTMYGTTKIFCNKVFSLDLVVERLRMVQIENLDALDVIKRYDSDVTLFYCDPPYIPRVMYSDKRYKCNMSYEHHEELAQLLRSVKAKVAISSYDCEEMDTLYSGWHKYCNKETVVCSSSYNKQLPDKKTLYKRECLWTNYDAYEATGQMRLL